MHCKHCRKAILIKRNFSNLFHFPYYFLCDFCLEQFPINLNYQHFLFEDKEVHWFWLFDEKIPVKIDYYLLEISKVIAYIETKVDLKNDCFLIFDEYPDMIDCLELISDLINGKYFFLTWFG